MKKYKTIFCKITDGDNITAVTSKKKAISRIKESNDSLTKKEIEYIFKYEWQEVFLD